MKGLVMNAFRKFLLDRSGTSAVEMAIIALPLFVLMFGAVEVGRAYWTDHAVRETAAAVARCVAVGHPDCSDAHGFSADRAVAHVNATARSFGVGLSEGSVTVVPDGECSGVGGFAVVTVSHRFRTPVPFLERFFEGGVPMTGTSCFPRA